MGEELKYQIRLTLADAAAETARRDPSNAALQDLPDIVGRHNATLVCQFDAFADYVASVEREGPEDDPLYAWTKKTIENAEKREKYLKSFTLYVDGDQVYDRHIADRLEAEIQPMVGGPIVRELKRYDTNPANNPHPPKRAEN